ncbi:ABC transporter permease [Salinisphaera dokdonensis CL-ES53]|uniref:ABC transporter permease n=1 Tax=Salinisphaera dokdonensis CL-ES53 TaxID=1304272 RepID=A0ABV2B2Y0_9GAMM
MDIVLQILVNGLMLGGLYAIVSVGLTLIFGVTRVINFAHGEFLMVGMYLVYLLTTRLEVHPYLTVVGVLPCLFLLGALTQKLIIERLQNSDEHVQIFATVGLSIALINLALLVFGADIASTPSSGLRTRISLASSGVLLGQLVIFVTAIGLVAGLQLVLSRTRLGRAIRATAQNRAAARLMGINVSRIYAFTFGLGAACVGLAAVMVAPLYPTSPNIGTYFVLIAFVVVVMGGLGSITGAFVAALIVGLVDAFASYYWGSDLKEVAVFGIFLLVLILRPSGLFGTARNLSHVSP